MASDLIMSFMKIFSMVVNFIYLVVLASVVLSFVNPDPNNQIVQIIRGITEPLYRPFRGINRKLNLPLDLSPMIVLAILIFIEKFIGLSLMRMARGGY